MYKKHFKVEKINLFSLLVREKNEQRRKKKKIEEKKMDEIRKRHENEQKEAIISRKTQR